MRLLLILLALTSFPAMAQQRKAPAPAARTVETHRVTFLNRSIRPIEQVFISSATASGWGDDLLGHDVIDTGSQATVIYQGPCRADVQVVFESGATEARRRIDVCQAATLTIEPGWTLAPNLGKTP